MEDIFAKLAKSSYYEVSIMPRKKSPATQLKELKAENEALKQELEQLRKSVTKNKTPAKPAGNPWKRLGAIVSVILAAALLVSGNLLFWAGNTIVDPERFNAVVSPLIKAPEVQQAVSQYTTTQLFDRVDVQQLLAENLPERISFAAPALASQIQSATQTALTRVMQNESFQQTWNSTIENVHAQFINFIGNYQGSGVISLSDVYNRLVDRLADTKLSFLSNVSLPSNIGSITLVNATWLPAAHNIVNNIGLYRIITTILCVGFVALAIWLSRRKRRTAIIIGVTFAIFMVLTLLAVRITGQQIVAGFASAYQPAIKVVSDGLLNSLILQTRVLFVLGVLIAFVAWISGPYKSASLVRSRIQLLFGGNIHNALFGTRENGFTRWLGRHKRVLQWAFVAIAALVVVTSPLSMATMLTVLIVLLVLILVLEILAAPQSVTLSTNKSE